MRHSELGKMPFGVHLLLKRWVLGLIVLAVGAFGLMNVPQRAAASVMLDYFKADWQADLATVVITWKTAMELDTTGFIVERGTSPGGGYVAITEMIPAVGDQLAGGTYGPVADDPLDLTMGVTYWYRLVVINRDALNDLISPVAVLAGVVWRKTYLPVITHGYISGKWRGADLTPSGKVAKAL